MLFHSWNPLNIWTLCMGREYAKDALPELKLGDGGSPLSDEQLDQLCSHVENAFADATQKAQAVAKLQHGTARLLPSVTRFDLSGMHAQRWLGTQ